jgi:hypothetical protein
LDGYIPFTEKTGVILAFEPSIGDGILFVPTGKIQSQQKGMPKAEGPIIAFGTR